MHNKPSYEVIPHSKKHESESDSEKDPDVLVETSSGQSAQQATAANIKLALIREMSSVSHRSAPESPTKRQLLDDK